MKSRVILDYFLTFYFFFIVFFKYVRKNFFTFAPQRVFISQYNLVILYFLYDIKKLIIIFNFVYFIKNKKTVINKRIELEKPHLKIQ